ncbi:alpha/beta fold hydrolase [Nonomuraea jabiensis]|uniref:alpha/beta fold hydrolase n=1 Tax=Nonomuraea jabiensis TaxID=882448 RepID=UPI003D7257EF
MIVFDQQGHGRTPDTSREPSYPRFADDAAALLRALTVERADVMGYSQGGRVALRHPDTGQRHAVSRLPQGRLVSAGGGGRRRFRYHMVGRYADAAMSRAGVPAARLVILPTTHVCR